MAFCPHCGKSVGEAASDCASCGKPLKAQEPRVKPARFKGTMLMTPTALPAGTKLPGGPQGPAAPAPQQPARAPVAAAPAPARAPAPAPAAAVGASKRNIKATMLGTGGAGGFMPAGPPPAAAPPAAAPPPAQQPPQAQPAPAQQPPPEAAWPTAEGRRVHDGPTQSLHPDSAPAPDALADTAPHPKGGGDAHGEDSQRMLVGDPMAPAQESSPAPALRTHDFPEHFERPRSGTGKLIAVVVLGFAAIAGVGYVAANVLDLLD